MQLDKSSGPERPGTMAFLVDAPAHYRLYLQTACERRLLLDCGLCVGQRLDVDLRTPPIALLGFRLLVDGKPQIRAGVTIKAVEPSPGEQVRAELHTDMEGRIVLPVFLGRWRVRPLADRELWSRILDVDRVDAEFGDLEVGKTRMWLRLLDERGAPVPDRYIVLGTPEEPMSRMPPPTDAEGRTTLVAIRRGHYQVHVSDPDAGNAGRPPYSPIGEIDVKDDREIELRLPKRPQ
jgi:hypothetical protein